MKPSDNLNLTVVTPNQEPREVTLTLGLQPDER
jgi:hypothetical protein